MEDDLRSPEDIKRRLELIEEDLCTARKTNARIGRAAEVLGVAVKRLARLEARRSGADLGTDDGDAT